MSNKNWKLFDFICDVHWESMMPEGEGKHCEICSKHIDDLTGLSRERTLHQLIKTRNEERCVGISHSLDSFKSVDILSAIVISSSGASYHERLYLLQLLSLVLVSPPETESLEGVSNSDMSIIFDSILYTSEEYKKLYYHSLERRQERLLDHLKRCSINGGGQMKEMILGRPDFSYEIIYGNTEDLNIGLSDEIELQTDFNELRSYLTHSINYSEYTSRQTIDLPSVVIIKLLVASGEISAIDCLTNWEGALRGFDQHLDALRRNVRFSQKATAELLLPISLIGNK